MMKHRWLALLLACLLAFPCCAGAEVPALTVDFDYLRQLSPNAVAWLYQPGTTINQPVVYSADRTFYLRHRYDDRYSGMGSIYITGEEAPDLNASVLTLRGKNCMDYSLFGLLSEYRKPEYYEANPSLYLITPDGFDRLDIFAGLRTVHSDRESWVVTAEQDLVAECLPAILEASFLTPRADFLPVQGDSWVVMTTEAADYSGNRYVIYARRRPVETGAGPVWQINQMDMDMRETQNGYFTVDGVGTWMLYGQNDPLWKRMIFEVAGSSRWRPFGDGGCGPTSVAMAIANLVPPEDLPKLHKAAANPLGYVFCVCCIEDHHCELNHVPYQLNTPEEYLRYFPLAVASFAMGNNIFEVQGRRDSFGTNMTYVDALYAVYGITKERASTLEEAVAFLKKENTIAVACVSGYGTPFTNTSHFLVLARATDEYLYVLDPLRRETYADRDPNGLLEVLTPGLVRVRLEDAPLCHFSSFQLLSYEP